MGLSPRTIGTVAAALALACASAQFEEPPTRAGVGLVLVKRGSLPVIAELVPGGPAAASGVVPGDAVLSVDGTPTANLSASDVAALLIGPNATRVELVIAMFPTGTRRQLSIERAPVFIRSVESSLLDSETLYIRIRTFSPDTPSEVARILREQREVRTLILDLRTNSGGQLEPAVRTADLFLPIGAQIGSLQPLRHGVGKTYVSEHEPIGSFHDEFILVNGDTAAGAELFCLALRAAKVATLVGARTLGYGTVETRWPDRPPVVDGILQGPGGLKFHRVGVEPDVRPPVDPARIFPPASDPLVEWLLGTTKHR